MNPIILWIFRNPVTSVLLVLCILLGLGWSICSKQLSHSRAQLKQLKADTVTVRSNVDALVSAVVSQNAAVEHAAKQGIAREKQAGRRAEAKLKPVAPTYYGPGAEEMNKWANSLP